MARTPNIISCILLVAALHLHCNVNAQVVTHDWFPVVETVIGPGDSLIGVTGMGTFTYDSSAITGSGFESINADQGLTL